MRVILLETTERRAKHVVEASRKGLHAAGIRTETVYEEAYEPRQGDLAVFYGLKNRRKGLVLNAGKYGAHTLCFDLGYWGRENGGKLFGYHRIAVNGFHTCPGFEYLDLPDDRLGLFHVEQSPRKHQGRHIMLFGQSAKAAWVYDYEPEAWERATVQLIRDCSGRRIVYVPKFSWPDRQPIEGTTYCDMPQGIAIDRYLAGAKAVVAHHSNACLWSALKGVPIYCMDGVARSLSMNSIADIETASSPHIEEVRRICANAAYFQWRPCEMETAAMWRKLVEIKVLPI